MGVDCAINYGSGAGDGAGSGFVEQCCLLAAGDIGKQRVNAGCRLAIWKAKADGSPANGGSGGPRKVGDIEEIPGPLRLCGKGALHATLNPGKWEGSRWFIVAMYPPIVQEDDKLGSLKREILTEIKPWGKR